MDLFDELRKAGPVDKKDFKKNEKDEKKKSSHDRDSEHKHKKHSEHKHSSSSPDHKKNSSHHEHKKSSSSSSHGKIDDNQHKKKHSSSSSSSSHGSSSKHEESPSKKSSSHGISINSKNNETPSRKNSLQDNEKHKSSGHSKKEDSSSSSSSKHHKSEGDSPKKKSKHDKERESSNKSSSNHVETSGKIKLLDTSSKDLEAVSKTKFNHDKELNSSSKDKKKSSLVDDEESPIKKKSSSEKNAENNSSKKLLNHDKDVAAKTTTKPTSPEKTLDQKVAKFNAQHKTNKVNNDTSNQRRESLPSPVPQPPMGIKKKADKSRSLSPPKSAIPMNIKPLKIKVERKRLEEFNTPKKANDNEELAMKKTPTKAQQKLFEPPAIVALKKTHKQILKEFKVKPCMVRIHRDNLKKLMREFSVNKLQPKLPKLILGAKRSAASSPTTVKLDGSPPMKKGKMSSPPKAKSGSFFIKLATPKADKIKLDKKSKHSFSKHNSKSSWQSSLSGSMSSSSAVAQHNKIKNSKSLATITPTKFSRTQLISTFGNHWFKSHVRIKRCKHPLMRIFESNARARHQQSKQNKSKNLSVSFRDQVEVFGGSTDSDDSYDENFSAIPTTSSRNGRRGSASNSAPAPIIPSTPIVMPARLKKVENGRVVDDIVLDPSLFLDPKALVASTPYSPGRKKRDHKSFSPLKDEGTPSPRKEQLKLANERIPPAGLRRLNIEEEDDEDDDCEYIVPIEMPQRRTSRTSSTNTVDGGGPAIIPPTFDDEVVPYNTSAIFSEIDDVISIAKGIVSPATVTSTNTDSNGATKDDEATSAATATVTTTTTSKEKEIVNTSDNTESRDSFHSANQNEDRPISSSPSLGLGDAFNHVTDNFASVGQTATDIPGLNGNANDIAMNLFIEDSQTNEDSPEKNYVDSIINETIDKLGRDMESPASDENYRNAI